MDLIWFPTLAFVTAVGVRLVGVWVGWIRGLLSAWLGLATSGIALSALTPGSGRPAIVPVIALGLLAMVAWTGIFEVVFPKARLRPSTNRELNPLRAVRHTVNRGRRKIEIGWIATRFGLGHHARRGASGLRGVATGRSMRLALERAGGVYVKLGQFLATRPDLLSNEITLELRQLHQHVEPVEWATIHEALTADLGQDIHQLTDITTAPTAAASIAQVHAAVLDDGRHVAVKIQRPDLSTQIQLDLDILIRFAEKLERRTDWAYQMRLLATVEGFAENVIGELDFEAEARNLRAITDAVSAHPRFVVPQAIEDLTRPRVLVMDWVEGVPLIDGAESLEPADRADLAKDVLRCFLDQILVGGTFHADPHPGNLLLQTDGRIALIDCGSIGMLDRLQRRTVHAMLAAIAAQDPARLRDALRPMTTTSGSINEPAFERALGVVLVQHLGAGDTVDAALITALMELMRQFGLAVEPILGGAMRSLATLQATLEALAPDFDLLGEATAFGKTLANPLSSSGPSSPRAELGSLLPTIMPMLADLPHRLDRIIGSVERNEVAVGVHLFPSDRDRHFIERLTAQIIAVVAPGAFGLIGALLIIAAGPRLGTQTGRTLQAVGIGAVGLSLIVLLSVLVAALRRRRERP